jgi:hypothetical protein
MRLDRIISAFVVVGGLAACQAEAPQVHVDGIRLDVVAESTGGQITAVSMSVAHGVAPTPLAAGECQAQSRPGPGLSAATRLEAEMTAPVPLVWSDGTQQHSAQVDARGQDLTWQPIRLHGVGPGGWLVDEASAAQVPVAPRVTSAVVDVDGDVLVRFQPGERAPTALVVDVGSRTWRCGVGDGQGRVPWWLAQGDLSRVQAERVRIELHQTVDGLHVVGTAAVRAPLQVQAVGVQRSTGLAPARATAPARPRSRHSRTTRPA